MSELSRTPLFDFHHALGARLVPFAGWEMPVSYSGIIEEHLAVRQRCGFFDVCHMGEFEVLGPQAEALLDHALTNRIAGTPPGKAVYSPMCTADGGTVDDLIVYRRGEADFLLVVNASNAAKDFAHLQALAENFDAELRDISAATALLAVQGPKAAELLMLLRPGVTECSGNPDTPDAAPLPKRFRHTALTLDGIPCRVSRTGYTGEDGFELFCASKDAPRLAQALTDAGQSIGALWCGLGARDSLRLEAGYPLYGHELSETLSPLMAGLGWAVKLDKDDFVGRDALTAQAADGQLPAVKFFTLEGRRIARQDTPVLDAHGVAVGKVLSGTLSPALNQPIGSALLDASASGEFHVDLRGNKVALTLKKPPLNG